MSYVDRVKNGERQATWWCGYCFGTGTYLTIPANDEAARREVYDRLNTRLAHHDCPRRPKRTLRSRYRPL